MTSVNVHWLMVEQMAQPRPEHTNWYLWAWTNTKSMALPKLWSQTRLPLSQCILTPGWVCIQWNLPQPWKPFLCWFAAFLWPTKGDTTVNFHLPVFHLPNDHNLLLLGSPLSLSSYFQSNFVRLLYINLSPFQTDCWKHIQDNQLFLKITCI